MIDKQLIIDTVEKAIKDTDIFLVDVHVTPDNNVTVEIDNPTGVDIDTCMRITRAIEADVDRDVEDYELEVGSAGLTAPFKVKGQYLKNIGNDIVVLTRDGRKIKGVLKDATDDTFTVTVSKKVKLEGKKRPEMVEEDITMPIADTKSVTYGIKF